MEVTWPRGEIQKFADLAVDRRYTVFQPDAGLSRSVNNEDRVALFHQQDSQTFPHRHATPGKPVDDFSIQPLLPFRPSRFGPGLRGRDIDGDGKTDLFHGQGGGTGSRLLKGEEGTRFSNLPQRYFNARELLPFEDMGSVFLDADSDGDLDLFVVSGGYSPRVSPLYLRDRLFLNDGQGMLSLGLSNTPNLRDSGGSVSACDFDRDGDLDLFVGGRVKRGKYPETPGSVLLLNEDGKFVDRTDTIAQGLERTGMVTSSLWSDFDSDGWTDLVLTTEWGPVEFWKNEKGKLVDRTQEAGTANRLGWWTSVTHADFDNDGDLDYVVGNMGLNSKYHVSEESLFGLLGRRRWLGSVAFRGSLQGKWTRLSRTGEKAAPLRQSPASPKNSRPFMLLPRPVFQKFTNLRFSSAPRKLEINELASGLLVNSGKGTFEFRKLPRLAQTSPLFGMAVADFDGDGMGRPGGESKLFFPCNPKPAA